MHLPGAQVRKPVHPATKLCTLGAGCTLNFEHRLSRKKETIIVSGTLLYRDPETFYDNLFFMIATVVIEKIYVYSNKILM